MNIKLLLLPIIVISGLSACSSSDRKFTITGDITEMPPQTIVLEQLNANDITVVIDSAKSKTDGHFELSGIAPETGLYRLRFSPGKFILLSVDKGNIKVDGNWNKLEDYTVTGSAASQDMKNILAAIRQFSLDNITMGMVLDTLKARGNDSLLTIARNEFADKRQHFTQFLEHYADTVAFEPNAVFAARILNPATEKHYLEAFSQSLKRRFPNTKMTNDFNDWYATIKGKQKQAEKSVDAGAVAPEITLPDLEGKMVSLSSFRGKYVLLDFWASWCQPCRGENPNVVAAYRKFKDKNFTVLGLSLDNQKGPWEKAIKDDSLTWTHVSDLNGWKSAAVTTYGVHSIPANFLIDPSGKIIGHDLRGSQLEEVLTEVLKTPAPTDSTKSEKPKEPTQKTDAKG
jgi:peroxiredoxin